MAMEAKRSAVDWEKLQDGREVAVGKRQGEDRAALGR